MKKEKAKKSPVQIRVAIESLRVETRKCSEEESGLETTKSRPRRYIVRAARDAVTTRNLGTTSVLLRPEQGRRGWKIGSPRRMTRAFSFPSTSGTVLFFKGRYLVAAGRLPLSEKKIVGLTRLPRLRTAGS